MKQNVALVLSSGGARGIAHIGIIRALEQNGYNITSISGSSIGALVGGIYAAGKLDEFEDWVCNMDKIDVVRLFDLTLSFQGFVRGEKVFKEIEKIVPHVQIEDLKIPFAAVATDVIGQKEVVFKEGSLFDAMRASVAIPTVMTPFRKDGLELVDGGILNPIPIAHIQRRPGDLLVAVNVNAAIPYHKAVLTKEEEAKKQKEYQLKLENFWKSWKKIFPNNGQQTQKKLGMLDLLSRSFDLMQDRLCNMILEHHHPDLVLNISKDACSTFEFYRSKEMLELGTKTFEKAIHKIELPDVAPSS